MCGNPLSFRRALPGRNSRRDTLPLIHWGTFMKRAWLSFLVSLSICLPLTAEDAPKKADPPGDAKSEAEKKNAISAADALKAAPNDPLAWRKYLSEQLPELMKLAESKPDEAKKKLAEIKTFVESISPEEQAGKAQAKSAN